MSPSPSEMPTQFDLGRAEQRLLIDRWVLSLSFGLGIALGMIASLLMILLVLLVGIFLGGLL